MKDVLKLPKAKPEDPMNKQRRLQTESLTIRFFELLITSGQVDIREPRRAALCAKHCAQTLMDVLHQPQESAS